MLYTTPEKSDNFTPFYNLAFVKYYLNPNRRQTYNIQNDVMTDTNLKHKTLNVGYIKLSLSTCKRNVFSLLYSFL
jgi:hypothetical protein